MAELGEVKLTKEQLAELTPEEVQEYKFVRRKTLRQAFKYLLCTASAGLIEFISFTILYNVAFTNVFPVEVPVAWLGNFTQDYRNFIASTIALILSVLWNFTLNRKFTFKSAGNVPRAMFLAFLFYVPFYPFKCWWNGNMPAIMCGGNTAAESYAILVTVCEVISMLLNGVLEFCWQKFFIYRKEEGTAVAVEVTTMGENGEILIPKQEFNNFEIYDLMKAGMLNKSDKEIKKWLAAKKKADAKASIVK